MFNKNNKYKKILIYTSIIILFTKCKSVEINFMGYFIKKYPKQTETVNPLMNSGNSTILKVDTGLTISGVISDSNNKFVHDVDVYVRLGNRIIFHTKSDINGKYNISGIKPGKYIFYLSAANMKSSIKEEREINVGVNLNEVNFEF